jgi:hypothetical protein
MANRFTVFDAYYMFASLYHGGQGSKEYAYFGRLDRLGYKAGLGASSQNPDRLSEDAREVYDRLVYEHEAPARAKTAKVKAKAERYLRLIGSFIERASESNGGYQWQVRSMLQNMQLHYNGYAEPGYTDPESGIIATGNWNDITKYVDNMRFTLSDIPSRIGNLFEKLGIPIEWSDEWVDCSHCGKLVRTEPDSMSWHPSYTMGEGELWCHECDEPDDESDKTEGQELND